MSALVVDTSALVAMLLEEPDAEPLMDRALAAPVLHLSAASRLELSLALEGGRLSAEPPEVEALLRHLAIVMVPFDQNQLHWALKGWRQFGKGRHPAALNLGDCFAYGLAMTLELPLLFKGEDFSSTDVKVAH